MPMDGRFEAMPPSLEEILHTFGLVPSRILVTETGPETGSRGSEREEGGGRPRMEEVTHPGSGASGGGGAVDLLSSPEAFERWLLSLARYGNYSDVYFSPGEVRLGIGGNVQSLNPPLPWNAAASRRLLKWLEAGAGDEESSLRLRQQLESRGTADTSWSCGGVRFRVNVFRTRQQLSFVFRRIPEAIADFGRLRLPPAVMTRLAMGLGHGLFLISGRAGSGKSATLSAFVQFWNRHRTQHIILIEDPMEYFYESQRCLIHQREVGIDVPSFAEGLRGALRQSPHIIGIGEIRDEETARMALQAAETGHLVIGTLHAGDAWGTLQRFTGLFPEAEQDRIWKRLVAVFSAVLTQWLLPLKAPDKAAGRLSTGRIPAIEILGSSYHIRQLLLNRHNGKEVIHQAMEQAREEGMITLDDYLYLLIKSGHIQMETALGVAHSPNNLKLRVQSEMGIE